MEEKKICLTSTDMEAISLQDSNYLNNKGARKYCEEDYKNAVEYYRVAAAMGNVQAISNLGYCYLYGRDIEKNLSLAIAYFKIAALKESVDAAYKLGDIYNGDKWGVKDREKSIYYYRMAASFVIDAGWEEDRVITWCRELQKYPSLCYALGRELATGEEMQKDIDCAYQFLKHAELGYKRELYNGNRMYEQSYVGVLKLLEAPLFDAVRAEYDELFNEECGEDEE